MREKTNDFERYLASNVAWLLPLGLAGARVWLTAMAYRFADQDLKATVMNEQWRELPVALGFVSFALVAGSALHAFQEPTRRPLTLLFVLLLYGGITIATFLLSDEARYKEEYAARRSLRLA